MDSDILKFIVLGNTHGFLNDFDKQKEIIRKYSPKVIFCEDLQEKSLKSKEDFEELLKKKFISELVDFNKIKPLIEICFRKKIQLIGIDFKDFGFNERQRKIINKIITPTKKDILEIEKISSKRENFQVQEINKFQKNVMASALIILGSWHLRNGSPLIKSLKNSLAIFPSRDDGTLVFEPTDSLINYSEKYYE